MLYKYLINMLLFCYRTVIIHPNIISYVRTNFCVTIKSLLRKSGQSSSLASASITI